MEVLLLAVGIIAFSGIPGLFLARRSAWGERLSAGMIALGAVLGLGASLDCLRGSAQRELLLPWSLPGAALHFRLDAISIVFLLPILLVSMLGSIYGLSYWKQSEHPENACRLRFFFGLLSAGMALLVMAHNTILFLVAWEIMALSAFMLVTSEDHDPRVRSAGYIYLLATRAATLALIAMFACLYHLTGSLSLDALSRDAHPGGLGTAIFVLALIGFGFKAGLMPLHVWLPSSHAIAPSHVSALMSGVIIKMGIYGLVRMTSLFPHAPLAWGAVLMGLGAISGILGVAFAIGQHDLKRLLAYHSIENIGIIAMGLGFALVGRALGRAEWVLLGLTGCLLHVWNHALFKSLLFFSAGSVIHATHTREIDHLGGLSKRMPVTAFCFLAGAVAICGLPPLNGFISEFCIYSGVIRTLGYSAPQSWAPAALAAPALALIGALAAACFAKALGMVFLGAPRGAHAAHARESAPSMLLPMLALVACCLGIGLAAPWIAPLFDLAQAAWTHGTLASAPLTQLARLHSISAMNAVLLGLVAVAWWTLRRRLRAGPSDSSVTWGCGYAAPTARMQYSSSSFAEMLVGLFRWALWPRTNRPRIVELFPANKIYYSRVPDTVLEYAILPLFRLFSRVAVGVRRVQQGNLQVYLLYVLAILLVLLAWKH